MLTIYNQRDIYNMQFTYSILKYFMLIHDFEIRKNISKVLIRNKDGDFFQILGRGLFVTSKAKLDNNLNKNYLKSC